MKENSSQLVVLKNNPIFGRDVEIQDFVVIGKSGSKKSVRRCRIGDNSKLCTGAVIYDGVRIGNNCLVGDQARIRENCLIGDNSVIGAHVCIENNSLIGNHVLVESQSHITAYMEIEDYVFVSAHVTTTNDSLMAHPLEFRRELAEKRILYGGVIRRGARIGAGAKILPGITIGEEAVVGAGSVVTRDVPPYTVAYGVPAKPVRIVGEYELLHIP